MEFEWNQAKNDINLRKHGVSFEEAKTVFENPLALNFFVSSVLVPQNVENSMTMNPTSPEPNNIEDDMASEYEFDYQEAKPNRFAPNHNLRVLILDEDVAKVFNTPNSVNHTLRALIKPSSN